MIVCLSAFRHSVAFIVNENALKNARVNGALVSIAKTPFMCHKSCRFENAIANATENAIAIGNANANANAALYYKTFYGGN
jgi:hypothetical protein